MIRAYADGDLEAVVDCFGRSVHELGAAAYGPEQRAVWAPAEPDRAAWARRLSTGCVLIAERAGRLAGFARVEPSGLVDLLYVHPSHARRGVGRALLEAVCAWAIGQGARRLEAEVSRVARPLFEAAGFRVERAQTVERAGVRLVNFRMARETGPEA